MSIGIPTQWFKSSHSGDSQTCVEVAFLSGDRVGVRDSKNPTGPALSIASEAWGAFTAGVRDGQFDRA